MLVSLTYPVYQWQGDIERKCPDWHSNRNMDLVVTGQGYNQNIITTFIISMAFWNCCTWDNDTSGGLWFPVEGRVLRLRVYPRNDLGELWIMRTRGACPPARSPSQEELSGQSQSSTRDIMYATYILLQLNYTTVNCTVQNSRRETSFIIISFIIISSVTSFSISRETLSRGTRWMFALES